MIIQIEKLPKFYKLPNCLKVHIWSHWQQTILPITLGRLMWYLTIHFGDKPVKLTMLQVTPKCTFSFLC